MSVFGARPLASTAAAQRRRPARTNRASQRPRWSTQIAGSSQQSSGVRWPPVVAGTQAEVRSGEGKGGGSPARAGRCALRGSSRFAAEARGDRLAVAQAAPVSANPSDPAFWTGHATRKGGAYLLQTAGIAQHTTCSRFRRRSRRHFRGAPTDAPLAGGGSVHGAAAAVGLWKGTGGLRRYWGAGGLSRRRGRYAAQAKTGAAQSLVRQALRSRWRGRCSVLNPEAWGWLLPTGDSMTPHEPPHAADCLLPTAWLPAAKTL